MCILSSKTSACIGWSNIWSKRSIHATMKLPRTCDDVHEHIAGLVASTFPAKGPPAFLLHTHTHIHTNHVLSFIPSSYLWVRIKNGFIYTLFFSIKCLLDVLLKFDLSCKFSSLRKDKTRQTPFEGCAGHRLGNCGSRVPFKLLFFFFWSDCFSCTGLLTISCCHLFCAQQQVVAFSEWMYIHVGLFQHPVRHDMMSSGYNTY